MLAKDLPIYRTTYDLNQLVLTYTKNFRRDLKQSLGGRIIDTSIELSLLVYKANSSRDLNVRKEYINSILENIQTLELSFRLAKDLQLISINQQAKLIEHTEDIGKQAQGWLKHTNKKNGQST